MAETKAKRPRTTGFCNPTVPRTPAYDPHQRCPGCECTALNCPCRRLNGIEDPPMTDPAPEAAPAFDPDELPSIDTAATDRLYLDPAQIIRNTEGMTAAQALTVVTAAADTLNTTLAGGVLDGTGWEDALRQLKTLREAVSILRALESNYVQHIYLTGEHGKQIVEGVGQVMIGRGRDRKKWEHEAVARDYVEAKIREGDGEMVDPDTVVSWVLEVAAPSYWRVTPLRDAGLDPNDYCVDEPGNLSVSLP